MNAGRTGHAVAPCGHAIADILVGSGRVAVIEQTLKGEGERAACKLVGEAVNSLCGGGGERAAVGKGVADSLESLSRAGPAILQRLAPDLEVRGGGQAGSESVDLAADMVVDRPDRGKAWQGVHGVIGMEGPAATGDGREDSPLQPCELRLLARRDDLVEAAVGAAHGCENGRAQRVDDAGVNPAGREMGVQVAMPGAPVGDASGDALKDEDVEDDGGEGWLVCGVLPPAQGVDSLVESRVSDGQPRAEGGGEFAE